ARYFLHLSGWLQLQTRSIANNAVRKSEKIIIFDKNREIMIIYDKNLERTLDIPKRQAEIMIRYKPHRYVKASEVRDVSDSGIDKDDEPTKPIDEPTKEDDRPTKPADEPI